MNQKYEHYYVPDQSPWPIVGAVALFFIAVGSSFPQCSPPPNKAHFEVDSRCLLRLRLSSSWLLLLVTNNMDCNRQRMLSCTWNNLQSTRHNLAREPLDWLVGWLLLQCAPTSSRECMKVSKRRETKRPRLASKVSVAVCSRAVAAAQLLLWFGQSMSRTRLVSQSQRKARPELWRGWWSWNISASSLPGLFSVSCCGQVE